jgi:hypothetical protein
MSTGKIPRVRFEGVAFEELSGGGCQARVDMMWQDEAFVGAAEGAGSDLGKLRCAAEATCDALQRVASSAATFEVLDLETVKVLDSQAVVVALAVHEGEDIRYSVGFCLITDDEGGEAAVKSVLNGTNRILAGLLPG